MLGNRCKYLLNLRPSTFDEITQSVQLARCNSALRHVQSGQSKEQNQGLESAQVLSCHQAGSVGVDLCNITTSRISERVCRCLYTETSGHHCLCVFNLSD